MCVFWGGGVVLLLIVELAVVTSSMFVDFCFFGLVFLTCGLSWGWLMCRVGSDFGAQVQIVWNLGPMSPIQ